MEPVDVPPGFRFHPTDQELVIHYLRPKVKGEPLKFNLIQEVDLYKFEPWDLPEKSFLKGSDSEWYFFSPRDKKYSKGLRTNRSTECGYWKVTSKDRVVKSCSKIIASKKTLVFHEGRASHGKKTDWLMYEYHLEEDMQRLSKGAVVLCHIIKKGGIHPSSVEDSTPLLNVQDDDDLPAAVDESVIESLLANESIAVSTELADIDFKAPESLSELEPFLGFQNFRTVSESMKLSSITADSTHPQMEEFDPDSFFIDNEDLPSGAALRADIYVHAEDEVIEELYDCLRHSLPPPEEDNINYNNRRDTCEIKLQPYDALNTQRGSSAWLWQANSADFQDENTQKETLLLCQQGAKTAGSDAFADKPDYEARRGSLADCDSLLSSYGCSDQSSQFLLDESGKTRSNVLNLPDLQTKNSTLAELQLQSFQGNSQSETNFRTVVEAPFVSQLLSSPQVISKLDSSQQQINSSQIRSPSVFAKLLDSMSVLPASAAEFPPNCENISFGVTSHTTIQEVPELRSPFAPSCSRLVNTQNRSSVSTLEIIPKKTSNSTCQRENRASISTFPSLALGALLAMSWILIMLIAWGFAQHLCSLLSQ